MICELDAKDLVKSYGGKELLGGLSFRIGHGESLAVVGPNGSGKTTLLKIIAGLIPPTRGEVDMREDGRSLSREELRRRMGIVLSEGSLYEELTSMENLSFFMKVRGFRSSYDYLMEILRKVGLKGAEEFLVSELSSGMKQRLRIAIAIAHNPGFLILDEPSLNLDQDGLHMLEGIMEEQKRRGIVVMATADPKEGDICDRIIELHP